MLNRSRSLLMKWNRLRLSPLRKPPWVLGLKWTPPRQRWACPVGWWTALVSSPLPVQSWRKCLTWWKGYVFVIPDCVAHHWACCFFVFFGHSHFVSVPTVMENLKKTWNSQLQYPRPGKVTEFSHNHWKFWKCLEICPCPLRIKRTCLFFYPHVGKCVIFEDFEKKQWHVWLQFSLQHYFTPSPSRAFQWTSLTEIIHAYLGHFPLCWFIWGRKCSPLKYGSASWQQTRSKILFYMYILK